MALAKVEPVEYVQLGATDEAQDKTARELINEIRKYEQDTPEYLSILRMVKARIRAHPEEVLEAEEILKTAPYEDDVRWVNEDGQTSTQDVTNNVMDAALIVQISQNLKQLNNEGMAEEKDLQVLESKVLEVPYKGFFSVMVRSSPRKTAYERVSYVVNAIVLAYNILRCIIVHISIFPEIFLQHLDILGWNPSYQENPMSVPATIFRFFNLYNVIVVLYLLKVRYSDIQRLLISISAFPHFQNVLKYAIANFFCLNWLAELFFLSGQSPSYNGFAWATSFLTMITTYFVVSPFGYLDKLYLPYGLKEKAKCVGIDFFTNWITILLSAVQSIFAVALLPYVGLMYCFPNAFGNQTVKSVYGPLLFVK